MLAVAFVVLSLPQDQAPAPSAAVTVQLTPRAPEAGSSLRWSPKGAKVELRPHDGALVGSLPLGPHGTAPVAVRLQRTADAAHFDVLLLDADRDGAFAANERLSTQPNERNGKWWSSFTAVIAVPAPGDDGTSSPPRPYPMSLWYVEDPEEPAAAPALRWSRRGWHEGTAEIAGKPAFVLITEMEMDGVFDQRDAWAIARDRKDLLAAGSRSLEQHVWLDGTAFRATAIDAHGRSLRLQAFDPGCTEAEEKQRSDTLAPDRAAARATAPVPFGHDLAAALAQAERDDTRVFVDFETTWCGPCKLMDQWVYTAADVVAAAGGTLAVKVDGDRHRDLTKRYEVTAYPTLLLLDSRGAELRRAVGYRSVAQMAAFLRQDPAPYWPKAGDWERRTPEQAGMDAARLAAAIAFAESRPTDMPADFATQEQIFGKLLGPMPKTRAATNGVVVRHGYLVAEFGDTSAVDPTYSVAKSLLSTVAGIAVRDGKIGALDEPVAARVHDGGYDGEQNAQVTWRHHLQQESEWSGSMWGKSHDFLGKEAFGQGARKPRALQAPGSFYEYNDVRINRLALSLLRVFGKSVPDVLRDEVMTPIGASTTWRWIPYDIAFVDVDGARLPSVSGGTRWGGGVWISTLDLARFGLLWQRGGRWGERQIVPADYVAAALQPSAHGPDYGFLWWLDTKGQNWPGLPKNAFGARGAGSNTVFVSPDHDLVIVWRWHATRDSADARFFAKVVEAIVK